MFDPTRDTFHGFAHNPKPFFRLFYVKMQENEGKTINLEAHRRKTTSLLSNLRTPLSSSATSPAPGETDMGKDIVDLHNDTLMNFFDSATIDRELSGENESHRGARKKIKSTISFSYSVTEALKDDRERSAAGFSRESQFPLFSPKKNRTEKLAIFIGYDNVDDERKGMLLARIKKNEKGKLEWILGGEEKPAVIDVIPHALTFAGFVDRPRVSGDASSIITVSYDVLPIFTAGSNPAENTLIHDVGKKAATQQPQNKSSKDKEADKIKASISPEEQAFADELAKERPTGTPPAPVTGKIGDPAKAFFESLLTTFCGAAPLGSKPDMFLSSELPGVVFDTSGIAHNLESAWSFSKGTDQSYFEFINEAAKKLRITVSVSYSTFFVEEVTFKSIQNTAAAKEGGGVQKDAGIQTGFDLTSVGASVNIYGHAPTHAVVLRYGYEVVDFSWNVKPPVQQKPDGNIQVAMYSDTGWAVYDINKDVIAAAVNDGHSIQWFFDEARRDIDAFIIRFTKLVGKAPPPERKDYPVGGGALVQLNLTLRHGIPSFPLGTAVVFTFGVGDGYLDSQHTVIDGILVPTYVTSPIYQVKKVSERIGSGEIYVQKLVCEA